MTEITKSGLKTHFLFNKLRSDQSISIVVFLFVLFCYELIAPTRLSSANFGSDGGDYLTAVLTGGVPHPTGYPLYLLLSEFFHFLPISTPVWQQVQVSIIASAACVACLCFFLLGLNYKLASPYRVWFAVVSSLLLAFSQLFWSQSVIIEVYTLHTLWIVLAIIWIGKYINQTNPVNRKEIVIFSWICGLGIANHTTFLLIYPFIIYAHYRMFIKHENKGWISLSFLGWISGALLYLILPIRAAQNPPIAWGDPSNLQGLIWLVTGGDYRNILFAVSPTEYLTRFFASLSLITQQFGYLGVLLGLIGIFQTKENSHFRWATIYITFSYLVFAIGYKTNDSLVYLLPLLVCMVIWICWGLCYLTKFQWKIINFGLSVSILLALSLCISIPGTSRSIDPRSGDLANYAESIIQNAKAGEILRPQMDGETFALWYYQYGLKWRPDVVIISDGLMQYTWYQEAVRKLYPNFINIR